MVLLAGPSVTSCRMLQPWFGLRAWTVIAANDMKRYHAIVIYSSLDWSFSTNNRCYQASSDWGYHPNLSKAVLWLLWLSDFFFVPTMGRSGYEGFHCNYLKCLRNNKFYVGSCIKCIRRLSSIEVKPGRTQCTVIALSDKSRTLDK